MIWTTEPPTSPGWYWLRSATIESRFYHEQESKNLIRQAIIVNVYRRLDQSLGFYLDLDAIGLSEIKSGEWAGPLPLPEDAPPAIKPRDRRNWRIVSGEHGENQVECCEGGHDRSAACEYEPVPGARWIPLDLTQPRLEENERTIYHQEYGLAGWVVLPEKQ